MMQNKLKKSIGAFILGLSIFFGAPAMADWWDDKQEMDELEEGSFYTLHDIDSGEELERLNRLCFEDDEIILSDNRRYRLSKIEEDGYRVHCEQITDYTAPVLAKAVGNMFSTAPTQAVAIYATHSDESYVPTSGTESKNGGGDILAVASIIAEDLESKGVEVLHSENIHDPHDAKAYTRSRRTAAELLKSGNVGMIIDVHRDGVPDPEYYEEEIDGKKMTQIRLVVGKANENSAENEAFAERLKAYYDEVKPGLIKSIYIAKGSYNQDMAPHAVLLEVGTHTNTLAEAKAGAQAFAEELPQFLTLMNDPTQAQFVTDDTEQQENNAENQGSEKDKANKGGILSGVIIVVLLGVLGGGVYLYMRDNKQ